MRDLVSAMRRGVGEPPDEPCRGPAHEVRGARPRARGRDRGARQELRERAGRTSPASVTGRWRSPASSRRPSSASSCAAGPARPAARRGGDAVGGRGAGPPRSGRRLRAGARCLSCAAQRHRRPGRLRGSGEDHASAAEARRSVGRERAPAPEPGRQPQRPQQRPQPSRRRGSRSPPDKQTTSRPHPEPAATDDAGGTGVSAAEPAVPAAQRQQAEPGKEAGNRRAAAPRGGGQQRSSAAEAALAGHDRDGGDGEGPRQLRGDHRVPAVARLGRWHRGTE